MQSVTSLRSVSHAAVTDGVAFFTLKTHDLFSNSPVHYCHHSHPLRLSIAGDRLSSFLVKSAAKNISIFTALHEMQTLSSDGNSVCPSVCLSVTRVIPDKMEERAVQIFIPYERTFILVF